MIKQCFRLLCKAFRPINRLLLGVIWRLFRYASFYDAGWDHLCPYLAGAYYTLKGTFGYENRAVLYGQLIHSSDSDARMFTLRRNIHRIEKGLTMRPRRALFAEEYIQETVKLFADFVEAKGSCDEDLVEWANEILLEYFACTGASSRILAAKESYESVRRSHSLASSGQGVHQQNETARSSMQIADLRTLCLQRKSVRWFLEKSVPRERIDAAIEIARYAPSACNRQPFEFHVIDDPDAVKDAALLPMGTSGYAHNIRCLVVIVGKLRAFAEERDRHLIYVDASLCAMLFQLALEAQELASCVINWPEIEHRERDITRLLNLRKDERPVLLLAVGFPDPAGNVAQSRRRAVEQLRCYPGDRVTCRGGQEERDPQ